MGRIAWLVVVAGCSQAAAPTTSPTDPDGLPPRAPGSAPSLTAANLCEQVVGAAVRHLEARCSADERQTAAYAHLHALASQRVRDCSETLGAAAAAGRVELTGDPAACRDWLASRSWKETLASRNITRFPACRGLVVPLQQAGDACHADVECATGTRCVNGRCATPLETCGGCELAQQVVGVFGARGPCGAGALCGERAKSKGDRDRTPWAGLDRALGTPPPQPPAPPPPFISPSPSSRRAADLGLEGIGEGGGGPPCAGIGDGSLGAVGSAHKCPTGAGIGVPHAAPSFVCLPAGKVNTACSLDSGCDGDLVCSGGSCVPHRRLEVGACCYAGTGDCRAGAVCREQQCRALGKTGEPCTTAGDCEGACGPDGRCMALCGAG